MDLRSQKIIDTLIVGAGLAGLTCAAHLSARGQSVVVLEKARGAGGRMSTRRNGEMRFDHGAQYFTARKEKFRRQVDLWLRAGLVTSWNAELAAWSDGSFTPVDNYNKRFVAIPDMNALAKDLAASLDSRYQARVDQLRHADGHWHVRSGDHTLMAKRLVVTAPPHQSAELLEPSSPKLAAKLRQTRMRPCWALMVEFPRRLNVPFAGVFVNQGPLSWICRMSSKPMRPDAEAWVIHASPEWSEGNLERPVGQVQSGILNAVEQLFGAQWLSPVTTVAHRWRYALAEAPLEVGCLTQPEQHLAVAGDWCAGSRIEGAYLSGLAAAEALT